LSEYGIDIEAYTGLKAEDVPDAARYPYRYNTKKLYGFCVPDTSSDSENTSALSSAAIETFQGLFEETVMNDKLTSYMADIATSWKLILICSGTAVVLGYIYLMLIRFIGGLIVWLSILLIQVSLLAGGYYVYIQHEEYDETSDYREYVKYAAYGLWGLAALYALCVCCCWSAIRIGIAVYKTTAVYVASNLRIFFLPMISYIVCGLWLAVWFISILYIFSVGEPSPRPGYEFITEIKWEGNTRNIVYYQILLMFWINAFIMGMSQFIIGCSACIWYFEVNSDL
jgi:hypothetical protein